MHTPEMKSYMATNGGIDNIEQYSHITSRYLCDGETNTNGWWSGHCDIEHRTDYYGKEHGTFEIKY